MASDNIIAIAQGVARVEAKSEATREYVKMLEEDLAAVRGQLKDGEDRIESLEQIIHNARKLFGYMFATALAIVSIFGAIGAYWNKVKLTIISVAEWVK